MEELKLFYKLDFNNISKANAYVNVSRLIDNSKIDKKSKLMKLYLDIFDYISEELYEEFDLGSYEKLFEVDDYLYIRIERFRVLMEELLMEEI